MIDAVQLFSGKLGIHQDRIKAGTLFLEDLNADSLDQVELIMACEDAYDLEISDEDAMKIHSVQEALDYLKSRGVDEKYLKCAA